MKERREQNMLCLVFRLMIVVMLSDADLESTQMTNIKEMQSLFERIGL